MKIRVIGTYNSSYNNLSDPYDLGQLIGKELEAEIYTSMCMYTGLPIRFYIGTTPDGGKINIHEGDCIVLNDNSTFGSSNTSSYSGRERCCSSPNVIKTTYKLQGIVEDKHCFHVCRSCGCEVTKEGWKL